VKSRGYCYTCGRRTRFVTDYLYADPIHVHHGKKVPNWRERQVCSRCQLNSRVRSCIHFLEAQLGAESSDAIYVTEQLTPLYRKLRRSYGGLTGSEYLGSGLPFGETSDKTGVRNETLTDLSFRDESFRFILSFDVFEHIPRYQAAFRECLRCLQPGGTLLFTVPFNMQTEEHVVRASIDDDGRVRHILPPEYHGDPVKTRGCLCFYHFGWELLTELRQIGYSGTAAHLLWSDGLGYLGDNQILFTATR